MSGTTDSFPSTQIPADSDWLERFARPFEAAWRAGERPDLDAHLPTADSRRLSVLRALVEIDLEYRLRHDEPARVEDYLSRFPELADHRDAVLSLIEAEYRWRCRHEAQTVCQGYLSRFPEYRDDLAARL